MIIDYVVILLLLSIGLIFFCLRHKHIDIWILSYLLSLFRKRQRAQGAVHIMFCFVDHFEPQWNTHDINVERHRVDQWLQDYPVLCENHFDADGKHPQHTFFYPEEEYRQEQLEKLSQLCQSGYGEVEVHLHHDNDTSANLRKTLTHFIDILYHHHGLLTKHPVTNQIVYGFIHGNWCLDNSRADGRWCGVKDELIVLKETGCYADFTLPSAPSETQTKKINSIYYAKQNPIKPKSHNTGLEVTVGGQSWGDLLIVQGPLTLNWKSRKFGLLPRIEAADIRTSILPLIERVDLWVNAGISVKGKPNWIFIKIHTHGTQERDRTTLLGKPCNDMFSYLETKYNDGVNYNLHYVTARETYNIIKAAEAGLEGNPNDYRDYLLKPPTYLQSISSL